MKYKSRKQQWLRASVVKMLTQLWGYTCTDVLKEKGYDPNTLNGWMKGPQTTHTLFFTLERINHGEAHWRTDGPCARMEMLGVKPAHPKTKAQTSRTKTREQFADWLKCGSPFTLYPDSLGYDQELGGETQEGVVQYIDWTSPLVNKFEVYEKWRGVLNDGFLWDMIITVNGIPMVAVLTAPRTSGHRPCEEAYDEMRHQLDADPFFDTYAMLCIISDGETTLVGSPDDPREWFFEWDVPSEVSDEAVKDGITDPRLWPYYALLKPEVLLEYLFVFCSLTGNADAGTLMRYCAHSHQYYAVLAAHRHLLEGYGPGYAVLPERDEEVRRYPFDTNYETTRELICDLSLLGNYENPDEEAEQERGATMQFYTKPNVGGTEPKGLCVYRPHHQLNAPLAQ